MYQLQIDCIVELLQNQPTSLEKFIAYDIYSFSTACIAVYLTNNMLLQYLFPNNNIIITYIDIQEIASAKAKLPPIPTQTK